MNQVRSQPYQPLLLRILHGIIALFSILAILTAFWTYNTYDGRWGTIPLPEFKEIEGIHGTFGLWTLLVFPFFIIYAFHRGQKRLIQSNSLIQLTAIGKPIWWYNLHRIINTMTILGLTLAVFSGKMINEKWLPQGSLDHGWYYTHLISWLILVICILSHILMSAKIGGLPLILSMLNRKYTPKDSPMLWRDQILAFKNHWRLILPKEWLKLPLIFKGLEIFILMTLVLAWLISIFK